MVPPHLLAGHWDVFAAVGTHHGHDQDDEHNAGFLQQSFGQVPGVVGFVVVRSSPPDATHATIALAIWVAMLIAVIYGVDAEAGRSVTARSKVASLTRRNFSRLTSTSTA
jgi:hypothetical protein